MIHGTATSYLDLSDKLVQAATGNSLTVVGINSGGTGYTVGDVLSVAGGTGTVTALVEVTSVSGGVIDGVRILNQGVYTVNPSSPNSATGGTGSGASLTLTFAANGWTANRNSTWSGSEKEVMLEGEGDGGDAIHVGWRTFSNAGSGYYNWELHGMTGYSSGQNMEGQPGVSPGFHDNANNPLKCGAYVLLHNVGLEYWFFITSYRIIGIVRVGTAYFNFYLGWGNRFTTESEYPYPLIVAGHTSSPTGISNQGQLTSGLTDPWRDDGADGNAAGPMFIRYTDGTWYSVWNGVAGTSSRAVARDRVVMPAGFPYGAEHNDIGQEDKFIYNVADLTEIIPYTGLTGTPTANLLPTPGSVDAYVLLPAPIVFYLPSHQMAAELDDVFWVSAFGGVVSEDRAIVGGNVYRIFQNCNRSDVYAYLAVKEV